jgi:exopolysaccharide biosynthesis protein
MAFDLSHTRVITDTGNDDNCSTGCNVFPLANYVSKNGGFAGVNGSYFCPDTYPECSGKTNSYDFPVYNTRLGKWINSDKLSWNERRAIFYVDGSGAHYQNNSAGFGGGLNAGIINYPGLLDGGNVQIDDNQSGLSDKQKAKNTKVGIGVIDNNHILVVIASNVNMLEFANVFKSLGAKGALNLDTGGSTAAIYNGRYIFGPGRNLPNTIIFANK